MSIRKEASRFSVVLDHEFIEWADREAERRDRSRNWIIQEGLRQWMNRLERDRERRRVKREG